MAVRLLTTAQYAEAMGVTERCVRRWCERGSVAAIRNNPRGKWMIPFDEETLARMAQANACAGDRKEYA